MSNMILNAYENNIIFKALKKLDSSYLDSIMNMLLKGNIKISNKQFKQIIDKANSKDSLQCINCNSSSIVKNGRDNFNRQRYRCKDCFRVFCLSSNSPIKYSKKSINQWLAYIECMCKGLTIRRTAEIVKIHRNTSFFWRHKILNAIKSKLPDNLEGIIEIDDVYLKESFKGNHSRNPNFSMGRSSIKRGGYSIYHYTNLAQICVLCCKDRQGNILSRAISKGPPGSGRINEILRDKIPNNAILCTNYKMTYASFAKINKLKIYRIRWQPYVKEEKYHINNARSFGIALKNFVKRFKGVATKYLNFYITWLKWFHIKEKHSDINRIIDIFLMIIFSDKTLKVGDFKNVTSL